MAEAPKTISFREHFVSNMNARFASRRIELRRLLLFLLVGADVALGVNLERAGR